MMSNNKELRPGRGVLLFSFNNEKMRYDLMAKECARRVTKYLDLPVVVITDSQIDGLECILISTPASNPRYYPDAKANLKFLNGSRAEAFDLSPFEETLVIDTDYLLQTDFLLRAFDLPGIKVSGSVFNIDGSEVADEMRTLGPSGLQTFYATVVCFDRSTTSKIFFAYWKAVIKNWEFYAAYFQFRGKLIRNDFAVTVALHKIFWAQGIPATISFGLNIALLPLDWSVSSTTRHQLVVHNKLSVASVSLPNVDIHVLNKSTLLEVLAAT